MSRTCFTLMPVCIFLYFGSAHAESSSGQQIFKERCTQCHASGPIQFTSDNDAIQNTLKTGNIKQHRFTLTDGNIASLLEYIASIRKSNATK
ncbi:hypothetical protein EDC63_13011 [Sulfurirhabdus autotrophica]|uniref:Cytochrome c domain-containing protein n=1 Tax=Sulfurirhabdus autotrophica TaxID=1706046 RepID=A0A4R3XTT1_9PROT|nr:hypothetical protein EDC63_13011 [Sulfurirhabdus autotrophica]